ncbi:hypothetical protein [Phormidesmis sp. 146-33]
MPLSSGRSLESVAIYWRYSHALSYPRLSQMFAQVFGLSISEGGLAQLFALRQDAIRRTSRVDFESLAESLSPRTEAKGWHPITETLRQASRPLISVSRRCHDSTDQSL